MQRDGDMDGDDSVAIVLDTFGDRRIGYYFRMNAAGARADGLVSGPEDVPLDWDGIWSGRAVRTMSGWTAEIRIPAATLRFGDMGNACGFNVER